jgi:ribosomal subunit interface protein
MELVVKARHTHVSPQLRQRIERKLGRLGRLIRRIQWIEVELIEEPRGRIGGGHRVEASCRTPRHTFRASGTGEDVDSALDRVVDRLERQLKDERGKRRARLLEGANRVKSRLISPNREEPEVPPRGLGE